MNNVSAKQIGRIGGTAAMACQGKPARRLVRAVTAALRSWRRRARQRRILAGLDDQLLRDIGRSRAQAARETGKPFWR